MRKPFGLAVPLLLSAVVGASTLTGCGVPDVLGDCSAASKTADAPASQINPTPRDEVRDGGNLRLAMSALPENYNALSNDGNNAESASMLNWMMPHSFTTNAAGQLTVNHNYFTDVQLTNTHPQQVTYTINPKAVWSDGTPITWEDIASEGHALSQKDPDYLIAISNGFDRVASIKRGVDDRQAIITFAQPYAEWKGQFAGNAFLYPKSVTANPDAFNKSLINGIPLTSGPFVIDSIDKAQQRITLKRNPRWWGDVPKLDRVTFTVLDPSASVPALQNNEIDATGLGSYEDIVAAKSNRHIAIRRAPGLSFSHFTFNGATGSILSDPQLRLAVSRGINRDEIARVMQKGVVCNPKPLNNHVYVRGQIGYQDNNGIVAFNESTAEHDLDALGWTPGADGIRYKDGRALAIRFVYVSAPSADQTAQLVQAQLRRIGVRLILDQRPSSGFFTEVIPKGDFDIAFFAWVGDVFPLSGLPQIYAYDPNNLQGNYGHIGSPELNALIDRTLSELDETKARVLANEVDLQIWAEGFSLPLLQSTGTAGVQDNVANYGAAGLASIDYTKVGFTR